MGVKGRVAALEKATGVTGSDWCTCPGRVRVVWQTGEAALPFVGGDAGPAPPEPDEDAVCPKCGKPRQTIVVEWCEEDDA